MIAVDFRSISTFAIICFSKQPSIEQRNEKKKNKK